ncbi:hypothetical protein A3731_14890 [Roseovarius sp. HI0049]|nr:hypothetical protein A3731_14890 [Roseovarius sp. HI0049]
MPPAPRSDGPVTLYRNAAWRLIEGQFRASTTRIVDTIDEQEVLENLLEESKPPVPEPCRHLDYQFWSPFRYGRYPCASRFRRAGPTPGVWYGAEQVLTAVAESIWGALRFFAASPGTPMPRNPVEHTAIQAELHTPFCADLTAPGWAALGNWTDPDDYTDCLALAEALRDRGVEAIRYASARAPDHAANIAVLACAAFAKPAPVALQTWRIQLTETRVRAHCDTLRQWHEFTVGPHALARA